jgi:DNA processing protein
MNWLPQLDKRAKVQRSLFIELTPNERILVELLQPVDQMHIDDINLKTNLNPSATAGALLNLELQGVVIRSPGKMYRMA